MICEPPGILRIGTSGVVVPGSKQTFPAEFQQKSRLSYYSSLFNTVEVNSTFQRIPRLSTLENWSLDVQEDFQFTIKLWKEITHLKQLDFKPENIATFISAISYIGNKKGCLLVQFPASITTKYDSEVNQILLALNEADRDNFWRKAIEFRSPTWYNDQTHELLDQYKATLVIHDMPKSKNMDFNKVAKFVYFRFHGPARDYRGSYSDEFLKEQAEYIQNLLNSGRDVYAYFNNTMGNAFQNAMSLKEMVEKQEHL